MHWRPHGEAYIGDMIPFYHDGRYHIFYLRRQGDRPYVWGHIVSSDMRTWEEWPDVVHPGDERDPDGRGCWTGSVVHHAGTFYCFYTGWNPSAPHMGRYPQTICLAVSRDLREWEKIDDNPILWPNERYYEPNDWRDPYVFYNEAAGEWWMIICARDKTAPRPRAGALALAVSPNLRDWEVREPLWSGGVCWAPECPDIFREAGRWYLVYSHGITRYRMAESPFGPWLAAAPDTLDGPHVRAAKTLWDGARRLLFGWVPTRAGACDDGAWEWGGHMAIPRVLVPQTDGAVLPAMPAEYAAAGDVDREQRPIESGAVKPLRGMWAFGSQAAEVSAPDGVALARIDVPANFVATFEVNLGSSAVDAGVLLRMREDGSAGWKVGIEQSNRRLALYRWDAWGDPEPEISRPLRVNPDEPLTVQVVCHGSIAEVFVDGKASLATRAYHPADGWMGLWIANGMARIEGLVIRPIEPLP
ncbi:MAG: family 43 glycosylhydrolase [Armatimonadetes bacterium]|nr:family 43 glycosylhydrolase [Armatimonadota bacterium]